jgi:hypothetical protein
MPREIIEAVSKAAINAGEAATCYSFQTVAWLRIIGTNQRGRRS